MPRKKKNLNEESLIPLEASDESDLPLFNTNGPHYSVTVDKSIKEDQGDVTALHSSEATSGVLSSNDGILTSNHGVLLSNSNAPSASASSVLSNVEQGAHEREQLTNAYAVDGASLSTSQKAATSGKVKKSSKSKITIIKPSTILVANPHDKYDLHANPFIYPIDPRTNLVCGLDEAGRGPLMGDVVAACVILDYQNPIEQLDDSKRLSEHKRDELAKLIKQQALAYGIGSCTPQEIDNINILNASFLAMQRAFDAMLGMLKSKGLSKVVNLALVDGNRTPKDIPIMCLPVVKGDAKVAEIAAASILAKTTRDAQMYALDKQFPQYEFAKHKGYPTKAHLSLLENLPLLPCYRLTYGPIKKLIDKRKQELEDEL